MLICLLPGHPRCRWLCFFSRTQRKIFNSNRCRMSVIKWQSMGPTALRVKGKTYTDKIKLNHEACDNTFSIYIIFYPWSTAMSNCPERVHNTRRVMHQCAQDSWNRSIKGKKLYKYCSVSCRDQLFRVLRPQCTVTSRSVSFGFVGVCFFYSQSRGSHWLPLYDWQTGTVKNLCLCSTEETKSPTSWMPWE